MRREGSLAGKPTNHSRLTGKCRVVNCERCHESLPLKKSRGKGKGRMKRVVSDIPSTHLLSDWRVNKPSRKAAAESPDSEEDEEVETSRGGETGKESEGWALSISLLLDTALEHIQESLAPVRTPDSLSDEEVLDFEAFKNECEVFQNEIEAGDSPTSAGGDSADSWSEISDGEDSDFEEWEDDWSLVEEEMAV